MPTEPIPGRSLVTRRAVVDIVRTATLGSYGVTGFSGGLLGRIREWLGFRPARAAGVVRPRVRDRARPHRGLRRADRRGGAPGRLGRPLRDPPRARARGRPPDDPRRRPALPAHGPARARRSWSSRRCTSATWPRAARTSPDGPRLMARRSCDGTGLLEAFRAAVANLEAHTDEINGLNVFPVPDGDTGTNMVATVKAALEEADAVAGQPADRIAAAISFGALMGARGNSGVITSQIFRGMSEGLAGKRRFNGLDLAYALSQGTKTAYGAVTKPVEGTILTVIREAADAAVASRRARRGHRGGADAPRWRPPRSPSPAPRRSSRSCARPASSIPVARACTGSSRAHCSTSSRAAGALRARRPRRRGRDRRRSSPTPTRASATRRCSCSRQRRPTRSTSTPCARTSRRSASPCWSPATARRSRCTSTTSARTW